MSANRNLETPAPGITPADIYFVIFRHKWKIIIMTLLGFVAAGIFYFVKQPLYQSEAKIIIRYISDRRNLNPSETGSQETKLVDLEQNVINDEIEILMSSDLAAKAATNYGPEKIMAQLGGGDNPVAAAGQIQAHLRVAPGKDSSVIHVIFSHPNPEVVQPVLNEIIQDYVQKSLETHRDIGISDDALQDKITQLRLEVTQTEDLLRIEKTNAGIISVADTEKAYSEQLMRIQDELLEAKANLFAHQSSLRELTSETKSGIVPTNSILNVPPDQVDRYRTVCLQLAVLEHKKNDYIVQGYTEENKLMVENSEHLLAAQKNKSQIEQTYPALIELDTSVPSTPNTDTTRESKEVGDSQQVAFLPLRIKVLEEQLTDVQAEEAKLNDAEAKISDLERTWKRQEENLNYYESLRDQSRIDSQLGSNRSANINEIQYPPPPYKDYSKFYKTLGALAVSGLVLGLLWAFLIELYLDRTVKRPVDLQVKLHIPFFLSIPDLNQNGRNRLPAAERRQLAFNGGKKTAEANGALEIASPTVNHALHSHYDALRDRLVNYFESINLTRKPKLVAITSTSKGAGVSTIAAGLAASLSETGDGRVLLVDMNLENGAAQQFVRGQPGCQLDDALLSDKRDQALVQDNLYVVSEGSNADKLPRVLPKRFASLVPKLKASDYDYIIFDMPPVTQTSVTTRLAQFMDTVMLVIESEKTDRDVVQQAHQLLQQSKANVTAVLNKTRKYIPSRLQHEINADM